MKQHPQLAFLVGVEDYRHIQPLHTPLQDISDLGQILKTNYCYTVHTCENPGLSNLQAFMQQITWETQNIDNFEDAFVLIYFAGHGVAQDSEAGIRGYLIPADGKRDDKATWFSMTDLLKVVESLPCRHTLLLLDCCFSGSLRWASKYRAISGFGEQEKLYSQHYRHFIERRSCQVMTSAAPDQLALDFVRRGTEARHSPFAECVIRGLQGEADAIPDKVITCAELFAYLQNHLAAVSGQCGNPQNASLFPLEKHDFGEYLFCMDGFNPDNLGVLAYHNPYRGLSAYELEDRPYYFGRTQAIETLLAEVSNNSLTVVLGASGTGKSSLVKAGIVPRLPGGKEDLIPIIKPGLTPLAELPAPASFNILVIDQLEQLVTQADEKEAQAFLLLMGDLLNSGKKIIATLRIDYESRLPKTPVLEGYWQRYLVPPFSADELREVIVTPTFREGRFIVPMSLVDRIIEEVIHYPGSLPLLSFTMRQLFERCKDNPYQNITTGDYEILGGVIGALQKKADAVYDTLPDDAHRNTMRCLMLRMVSLTGGQVAGRRVLISELHFADPAENERLKTVQAHMVDERLILASRDQNGKEFIEPVHDALVNTWDKVQQWVKSLGDVNVLLYDELETAVSKYHREDRKTSHLWHNHVGLAQVLAVQKKEEKRILLNELEVDFLEKSRKRRRRNAIRTWVIVAGVIMGLGGLAWFGFEQAGKAEKSALEANNEKNNALKLQRLAEDEQRNAENQKSIAEYERDNARTAEEQAIFQKEKVEKENRAASNISFALRMIDTDPTLALRAVEYTMQRHPDNAAAYSIFHDIISDTSHLFYKQTLRANPLIDHVFSVAFSPDGQYIITGHFDKAARLWTTKGKLLHTFRKHKATITSVAFSPKGTSILTGSVDRTAILWSLDGNVLSEFKEHKKAIRSVAFSPDGQAVLTGSDDKTAKRWSLDGQLQQSFDGHTDIVNSVAFSPDGQVVLTGSDDKTAKLWSLNGKPLKTLAENNGGVTSAVFSPDGQKILTGSNDWTAKLWSIDGELKLTLDEHTDYITSVAFTPDGKNIITGSRDWTARLWSINGTVKSILKGHLTTVEDVDISPDGQTIITASVDGTVKLWSLNHNLLLTLAGHQNGISNAVFSPDGKMILTSSNDKTAKLWSIDGNIIRTFEDHKAVLMAVTFSHDNKMVLTGSMDKTAKLWSIDGKLITTFTGHEGGVSSVAFSPDDKTVLTGSRDQSMKLWTINGALKLTIKEEAGSINSLAFSPDGKIIASAASRTLNLRSLNGKLRSTLGGHSNVILSLAFSPDGTHIITGGSDEKLILWSTKGELITSFVCGETINSVAFSPNGKTILTGGFNKTAKLWTLNGKLICTFEGHERDVYSVAFSPDGNKILTGSYDKTAKLWMAPQSFLDERIRKFSMGELLKRGAQIEPEDIKSINQKQNNK